MAQTLFLYGLYVYILYSIWFFFRHCLNLAFVGVTLLYFVIITAFICILLYGSAFSLMWNYSLWHQWTGLAPFPVTLTNGAPDASTIPKTSSTYWLWTIVTTSVYLTFPQSVWRGANLRLDKEETSLFRYFKEMRYYKYVHYLKFLSFFRGITVNVYNISEGFFAVVITAFSLLSPFHNVTWPLMLPGCYFIILISGYDLAGMGPASIILQPLAPTILYNMQQLVVLSLKIVLGLLSFIIGLSVAWVLLSIYLDAYHQTTAPWYLILIIVIAGILVIWLLFSLLFKMITFPLKKLINLLGIKVIQSAEL